MSKLFISNDRDFISEVVEKNVASGFVDYDILEIEGFQVVRFNKLIHKVDNLYQCEGGFVAAVGTILYKDLFSNPAMKAMYEDFAGDPLAVLNDCVGNFLIAVYKNNELTIFTDRYQVIRSYYSLGKKWAVANDLADFSLFDSVSSVEEICFNEVVSNSILVSSFGEDTIFKKVKRLMGYRYLTLSPNAELVVNDLDWERSRWDFSGKTKQEIAHDYSKMVLKVVEGIKLHFSDDFGLHQTGGLDNRTILAALLNAGIRPTMMYGVGNSSLTNTKKEDLEVVQQYSEGLGLELRVMDWSTNIDDDLASSAESFAKYGLFYGIYGGAKGYFANYDNASVSKFLECGYFLENLRLREAARDMKNNISIEEFVDGYLLGGGYGKPKAVVKDYHSYRDEVIKTLQQQAKFYKIDLSKGVNKQNFDELRWVHARHADGLTANFFNLFTSSFSIFSQAELHEYPFDVNWQFRDNAGFQLEVIRELYPELLDYTFFTHIRLHTLDRERMVLQPVLNKRAVINTFKTKVSKFIKNHFGESAHSLISNTVNFRKKRHQEIAYTERRIKEFVSKVLQDSFLRDNFEGGGVLLALPIQ